QSRPRASPGDSAPPAPATPSFAELLQLVQRGQAPAGVRYPNASPTNDSPTASRLPRPPKPWESHPGRWGMRELLPAQLLILTAPSSWCSASH
uniref:Peroxisomal membrane protein PEX14-like KPWE domain-containing protein n=1 Tax=Coturnix japonica TaxID=93934 RepID=A0A8C2SUW4_COTJA